MSQPPFHSREGDPQSHPRDVPRALEAGWYIDLDPGRAPTRPTEFGHHVFVTSQRARRAGVEATVGPIRFTLSVEALPDLEDDDALNGWDAAQAVVGLAGDAARNGTRVRLRNLPDIEGVTYELVVSDVTFDDPVVKRSHATLTVHGELGVRPAPDMVVLDLTPERFDPSGAIITFGSDEDSQGVSLRPARDLDIGVIASLVRRAEVEAFAGADYDPARLIDDVQHGRDGRWIYVALLHGHPFGFVTLTDRHGGIATMCFMIAEAGSRGRRLARSIFDQGLGKAVRHGFETVVGLTEPPCYMEHAIQRAGGTITERPDGRLAWRVDLRSQESR